MSDVTIWTREQIRQVRSAGSVVMTDRSELERYRGEIIDGLHRKMARAIIEACRTFAVEVHPEDVQMREDADGSTQFAVQHRAAWRPETHEAELHGGIADGEIIAVQRIGDAVNIVARQGVDWSADAPHVPERAYVTYELDGWNEATRRWVYRP